MKQSTDKIISIEQNIEKNNRRSEIASQIIKLAVLTHTKDIKCASLAGSKWLFEHHLDNRIEIDALNLNTTYYSAENELDVAIEAIKHKPVNSVLVKNSFHYLMTREIVVNKVGIGSVIESVRDDEKDFNVIWADYCGVPNRELIRNVNGYIRKMHNGVIYVTFALSTRGKGGKSTLCKNLRIAKTKIGESLYKQLVNNVDNKTKLVYNVTYRGGQRTHMITIGISVGGWAKAKMPVISKDTRIPASKNQAVQTWTRYKNNPKLFKGRKKKDVVKHNPITKEHRQAIYDMFADGMPNHVIAELTGLSTRKIGAMSSWYRHPESFRK